MAPAFHKEQVVDGKTEWFGLARNIDLDAVMPFQRHGGRKKYAWAGRGRNKALYPACRRSAVTDNLRIRRPGVPDAVDEQAGPRPGENGPEPGLRLLRVLPR